MSLNSGRPQTHQDLILCSQCLSPEEQGWCSFGISKRHTDWETEIAKAKSRPLFDLSDTSKALAMMRHMVTLEEQKDSPETDVSEEIIQIPSRDGVLLPSKVFRRATNASIRDDRTSKSPLIVLFFPGGFIFGSPTLMAALARLLVKRFNARSDT